MAANGIGTLNTDMFLGLLPDTPAACVSIHEYAGRMGVYTMGSGGAHLERPRFQVMARAANYATARTKIQDAYVLLDAVLDATLSGKRYLRIQALAPPFFVQRDTGNRPMFVCNFEVMKAV